MNKTHKISRIISLVVACLMIAVSFGTQATITVNAASDVRIGHATNDERGKLRGGKAGDQTGKEVATARWSYGSGYNSWTFVARAKDANTAKKLAKQMQAACDNNHIGYDHDSRMTIYTAAEKVNFNMAAITKNVECDCISLITTVSKAAGAPINKYASSRDLKSRIKSTGKYDIYTGKDYTASCSKLQPGDILCTEGKHAAIVVSSPNEPTVTTPAENENSTTKKAKFKAGRDYVLKVDLNVRKGPGTDYGIKKYTDLTKNAKKHAYKDCKNAILKKGTVVTCIKSRGEWIKIPSGWICGQFGNEKYLKLKK